MPTGHQPLLLKETIIEYLRFVCNELTPIVEVSGVYPSSDDVVPYGVYVRDCHPINREVNQGGVTNCGKIYTVTDEFEILYVSYQNDPQSIVVLGAINDLAANSDIFDGYITVTFNKTEVIGNRSEKHTYTFNTTRLDFND
jgi:hypothetical protein